MSLVIGVDTGGTFTDVTAWDLDTREEFTTKTSSTPPDLEVGVLRGVERILELSGRRPDQVERVVHGTTISLNAILQQRGARLGILTTAGFEGNLVMGRGARQRIYDFDLESETPTFLCPPGRILGITGRIAADGTQITPLDRDGVIAAASRLRELEVEAIAVSYLHSYVNPSHEQQTSEILAELLPDVHVSLSSVVDPRFREYERLCLTAFDAYVKPVTKAYLQRLHDRLRGLGVPRQLQIMQCRGGISQATQVLERPVVTVLSGPAAGAIGGSYAGRIAGSSDLITVDIGGTSCDIALVRDNTPLVSLEGQVEGYPLRQPMVDVSCIGTGGGSIGWLDAAGGLRVGPHSAGAVPGPACYGQGGTEPTVTDASVALGYLNPDRFAYGALHLDVEAARTSLDLVGSRLGLSTDAVALGIHEISNARIAEELRLVSLGHGFDPRQFDLVALGGGGGIHAGRLAALLGVPTVIVPPSPGVLAALGLLVAAVEHDEAMAHPSRLDEIGVERLESSFRQLESRVRARIDETAAEGSAAVRTRRSAELRYVGQSYELELPLDGGPLDDTALARLTEAFHRRHEEIYRHATPDVPVEITSVRVVQSYPLRRPDPVAHPPVGEDASAAITSRRPVLFDLQHGHLDTAIYDRLLLRSGMRFAGPAIVEQSDTTTLVHPGQHVEVDAFGNLLLSVRPDR